MSSACWSFPWRSISGAWPAIQVKIKEVSALQGKLEEEVLRCSLAFQEHLKPEQRAAFIAFMERRMPSAPGGKGRRPPPFPRRTITGRCRPEANRLPRNVASGR